MNDENNRKKINSVARNNDWGTFLLTTDTMKKLTLLASVSLLASSFTYAGGEGWMHDFEAAKAKAAKENKDLLIDFTGSDWCHWCIKLNEEVFQHDPFKKGVADKYVLVELDYPNDKSKMDEATIAQNDELQKTYAIQGFPTILLTDAMGRPYAKTGYQQGGPEAYVTHLAELNTAKEKRDEALAAANKLEGVEKAKALFGALQVVPEDYRSLYPDVITEIKNLDPKDETGIAAAEMIRVAMEDLESGLESAMRGKDSEKALSLIDGFVKTHDPKDEQKQEVLAIKVNILLQDKKFDELDKVLDEIVAAKPDSRISTSVQSFRENQLPKIKEAAAKEATEEKTEPKEDAVSE